MGVVTLVEARPRRAADGAEEVVRLVHNSVDRADFFSEQWLPQLLAPPTRASSLGFDGQRFGGGATPTVGDLAIALTDASTRWAGLIWRGAPVTIRRAAWTADRRDPEDAAFAIWWQGRCDLARADEPGVLRVTMIDPGDVLRRPAAPRKFGATGDALLDGAAAQAGNVVPVGWGRLQSVPAILVEPANNIWLLLGQAATSIEAIYDGGAALDIGVARPGLAALRANAPMEGAADWCLDAGGLTLARPWFAPANAKALTADVTVGDPRVGSICAAMVAARAPLLPLRAGTPAALNALLSAEAGLYLADQTSVAEALDRLLAPVGCWWKLRLDGELELRRWGYAAPVRRVESSERQRIRRTAAVMPTRRRTLGCKPNWRPHNEAEIAKALFASAGNMLPGASLAGNWQFANGGGRTRLTGTYEGIPDGWYAELSAPAAIVWFGDWADVDGATVLFYTYFIASNYASGPLADTVNASVAFRDAGGGEWAVNLSAGSARTLAQVYGGQVVTVRIDVPPTATHVRPYNERPVFGGFSFYLAGGVLGRAQPGADVTALNTAANSGALGGVAAENIAAAIGSAGQTAQWGGVGGRPVELTDDRVRAALNGAGRLNSRRALSAFFGSGAQQLYTGNPLAATTNGSGVSTINVLAHDVLDDAGAIGFNGATITGLSPGVLYYVYEDNPDYSGGARAYVPTTDRNSLAAAGRRYVGAVGTPATSGGGGTGTPGPGGGWGGGGNPIP